MTRPHNDSLPQVPTDWTPRQALAVYEFMIDLVEAIWQEYEDPILDLVHVEMDQEDNQQGDLFDFNDEIPF